MDSLVQLPRTTNLYSVLTINKTNFQIMKKTITQTLLSAFAFLFMITPSFGQVSFTNMAGTIYTTSGGGQEDCVADMNGDHLDDIVRIQGNDIRINYQQEDGTYTESMFDVNLQNGPGWSMAAGDLNNDGFNDLVLGDGDAVSFVMAINGGTDYQEQAIPEYIFSQRTTMADIDNDGDLDAFVCHDVDQSHPYRNDGTGFMTEDQTLIETLPLAGNYAAIWVDYDNDGDSDMYLTKCRQGSTSGDIERTNAMYQNDGNGVFTEVGAQCNMDDNAQSWATVFEDFDNDGDFDAFIVNHDFNNRFMENNGDGTFTDIIQTTGIAANDLGAWENAAADFDNDGFVDIFSELGNALYMNNGDMTFTGMNLNFNDGAIGDLNDDGFVDVVNGSAIWMNNTNDNNWIKFTLQGIISNKCGIGARVEIHGDWGIQIREVRSGQSFSPMSTLTAHFGIGQSSSVDQVIVRWPSGIVTVVPNPDINEGHLILESECLLDPTDITVDGPTVLCPGEIVTLTVPEGFENYYWNNGMSGSTIDVSSAGSYSVVLIDADECASLSNNVVVEMTNDVQPLIETSGPIAFCEGGSVTLTVDGGTNPTWSNGEAATSIEVATSGTYSVATDANCLGGQLSSEMVEVEVISYPTNPMITSADLNGDNTATLTATGNNPAWFDVPVGGIALGVGNTYTSEPLTDATTFYVEDQNLLVGVTQTGGKDSATGPGGLPSTGAHSFFDAYEPFTILTVDVLVPNNADAGPRTIQLFNENDVMLAQKIFDLEIGAHTLELDFEVPVGDQFSIRCVQDNLFRNSGGVNYPYPIGDVGELTGSVYGASYYYYFYNWQIQKESTVCASERESVEMVPVAIDEIESINSLDVYPNPATTNLSVQFNATTSETLTVSLFNVVGKLASNAIVTDLNLGQNLINVDVSELPSGIYNLELQMNGQKTTRKVVVE